MNQVIISGNIVGNTNNNQKLYTYYKGNENKKSVLNFLVSVKRPFGKKDENGYYYNGQPGRKHGGTVPHGFQYA